MSADKGEIIKQNGFPKTFMVKYLGNHPAKGLWGIKHTRKPVDELVTQAKVIEKNGKILPLLNIIIDLKGLTYTDVTSKKVKLDPVHFSVEAISYGVQDLIYTRVFTIIVVADAAEKITSSASPFTCHSFLCDSSAKARELTYALAASFEVYAAEMKGKNAPTKRFEIDLRTPEEQAEEDETEA